MDSRTYWAKRSEIREIRAYSSCLETTRKLVNAYRKVGADIRREINDFYGRFATENKIDYADAMRYLNNNEVLEWRDSVEGYIEEIRKEQNPGIRERLFREYNARAYGSRITRLESLSGSIDNKLSQLYARANEQFREVLGENYTDGYYRTIYDIQNRFGYSSMFATVNDRIVENAVSYPWSGANFSDRLWKQKADLLNQLRETLTTGFIRGESVQDMARRIAKRLEVSQSNALRLLRTESSHIHNVAELDAYRECGFEEYEFMASFSERTCEVCGRLDGKRFKLRDKQYGVNFPPLHPNCRCTTIAFDPDDNLEDMKSGEMGYEEWKRGFVTGRSNSEIVNSLEKDVEKSLDISGESGIIKADEKLSELGAFKQKARSDKRMSDEYYQAVKEKFSHGTDTAKAVFNKYVPKNSVADTEYIYNAHYNPSNKMVYLNYASDLMNDRGACASWFHEHGHLIDDIAGNISNNAKFRRLLDEDYHAYMLSYGKKHNLKTFDKVQTAIGKELSTMRNHSAVSDLLNGLSKGNINGRAGHDMDYWKDDSVYCAEAFAHMFEAQFDADRYAEMKKYFPSSLKKFEEILGGLL